jgi:hypothetical protein
MKVFLLQLSGLMIIFAAFSLTLLGQMTSTETIEKGSIYVEANVGSGTQRHRNGGQQVYGGRLSYGLKNGLEIGLNGSGSKPLTAEYPLEIQPNIKWKFYQNEKTGVESSVGTIAFIPLAKRSGTNTFVMTYANISKKAKFGTRFTTGVYTLINHKKDFGSNKGVNLMIEKALTKKASFSVQWMSGKNRFGFLTGGVNYQIGKKTSMFFGYNVGNHSYDNHGPFISFGRYF